MNPRRLVPLGVGLGVGVAGAVALNSAPSLIALSSIGRSRPSFSIRIV